MQQWPSFRGPYASGIMDHASTPVTWDVEAGENIKWKTPIPGLGHSCPVIWEDKLFITTAVSGGGDAPAPTPVIAHDLIFINNAHGRYSPIYVIKPDATGDITLEDDSTSNEYIVWSIRRGGAYMQTPLIYGNYLYNCRMNGSLTCFQATTGEVKYRENLGVSGGISTSGIASDNKLYFTAENGDVFVVKAGPDYELISKNNMGDICMATPAITKGTIFFRTQHYVIAVSEELK